MSIHLNWLDSLLLVILLVTFIIGLVKGFIRQVIGILAVVGGVILAARYYAWLSWKLFGLVESDFWRNALSFLLIFFGVVLAGWALGFILSKLMKGSLSLTNHLLGGALGLLKGILIGAVIILAMLSFDFQREAIIGSRLAPSMIKIARGLALLIPQDLKDHFRDTVKHFEGKRGGHEQKI
ncbi:MAG: CvpA family protein [Candidatus Saccharicenans sp.]|uniref:CvpA family protein n=1 Tax=Candidatus Saccharicenans sp. TaxID=2819258 RepID=UPI00404AAACD